LRKDERSFAVVAHTVQRSRPAVASGTHLIDLILLWCFQWRVCKLQTASSRRRGF
jgi:hypothetical protein